MVHPAFFETMRQSIIITRPLAQSQEFAKTLETRLPGKFLSVISPLLEIRPEPGSVDTSGAQALMFSSRNGVREFARRSSDRSLPALCVGDGTAHEASEVGFAAMSAQGDVSALAALAVDSYLPDFGFMLHFRGAESRGDLVGSLLGEGIPAEERIIYDQFPLYLTTQAKEAIDGQQAVALAFSPRSANLLADEIRDLNTSGVSIVAISLNAAAPFEGLTIAQAYAAPVPNSEAILQVLRNF